MFGTLVMLAILGEAGFTIFHILQIRQLRLPFVNSLSETIHWWTLGLSCVCVLKLCAPLSSSFTRDNKSQTGLFVVFGSQCLVSWLRLHHYGPFSLLYTGDPVPGSSALWLKMSQTTARNTQFSCFMEK